MSGSGSDADMQGFAGVDPQRVKDVVSAVWDHKDDVASAVEFVRDHGDDLVRLAGRLPELLGSVSQFLTGAADDARSAAAFLTGDGSGSGAAGSGSGSSGSSGGGVKALAALAGEALDACRTELASARQLLDSLGDELAAVPVPSVKPTYSDVLGHKLVTGLDLGEGRLLEPASSRLHDGAARFDSVGEGLAKVADALRRIGDAVDDAGRGLARTAAQLEDGGRAIGGLAS